MLELEGLAGRDEQIVVRVERASGTTQRVADGRDPRVLVADARAASVVARYAALGVEHILLGIEHLAFLVAMRFLVRDRRALIRTITAFMLGHSVTRSRQRRSACCACRRHPPRRWSRSASSSRRARRSRRTASIRARHPDAASRARGGELRPAARPRFRGRAPRGRASRRRDRSGAPLVQRRGRGGADRHSCSRSCLRRVSSVAHRELGAPRAPHPRSGRRVLGDGARARDRDERRTEKARSSARALLGMCLGCTTPRAPSSRCSRGPIATTT